MEIFDTINKQIDSNSVGNSVSNIKKTDTSATQNTIDTSKQTTQEQNAQNKEEIKEQLNNAVKNLNKQMDRLNTNISFGFNDKIDSMYVDVKEKDTGKLIRKFPSEEAMKLTEHFKKIIGIIFDEKG